MPWRCIVGMFCVLMGAASVSAATYFVGAKRIGTGPLAPFYWNPTNVVINANKFPLAVRGKQRSDIMYVRQHHGMTEGQSRAAPGTPGRVSG